MDRIAEIKTRCEAATPGAWKHEEAADYSMIYDAQGKASDPLALVGSNTDDADFIAHAREDIPYLLEQLEEAQQLAAAAVADLIFVCGTEPSACDGSSICDICAHQEGCKEACCMNATGGLNRWQWCGPGK